MIKTLGNLVASFVKSHHDWNLSVIVIFLLAERSQGGHKLCGAGALYLVQVAIVLCQVCVDGDIGHGVGALTGFNASQILLSIVLKCQLFQLWNMP